MARSALLDRAPVLVCSRSRCIQSPFPEAPMASRKDRREKKQDLFKFFHVDPKFWPYEPLIDEIVTEIINPHDRDRFPGVAVAVRVNQQLVHLNCYGSANLET